MNPDRPAPVGAAADRTPYVNDWVGHLEATIAASDRERLPELLGALARLEALARLRLAEHGGSPEPQPEGKPAERLMDVNAAAELLGVEPRWIYDRADRLPFTRRLGKRTLRFSESGLLRWLETRR